ncbi:MAG: class I SAM-dependent methyltransferase [Bacteroidales bacterium]|nr:class I SAM-dependent methyltransferase [Bacteroidales bacterium]
MESNKDPMGAAILDYHRYGKASKLRVRSSQFEEDEIPVETLFRDWNEMSPLEKKAIELCQGKILDVGAGSGCHSLILHKRSKDVEAIDISPNAVTVMQERGLRAKLYDVFDPSFTGQYDTILLLMNGSGIIGKIERLENFFQRMRALLSPKGYILMDSSDLKYLYEEEDGSYLIDINDNYYGEIDYQMIYKSIKGASFDWLYIDFETLAYYAKSYGFQAELVHQGEHYDYLAKLSVVK